MDPQHALAGALLLAVAAGGPTRQPPGMKHGSPAQPGLDELAQEELRSTVASGAVVAQTST